MSRAEVEVLPYRGFFMYVDQLGGAFGALNHCRPSLCAGARCTDASVLGRVVLIRTSRM
jgi:hypothetical protein